jgi:hypothetical protein
MEAGAPSMNDKELEEIEALWKRAIEDVGTSTFAYRSLVTTPRLIAALKDAQGNYGNAVEAMRLCMKDLQEYGVIFAPGDPPYDILEKYDNQEIS